MAEENILDLSDDDISCLSQTEAQKHIDHFLRTSGNDPQNPYCDAHNSQHKRAVERISKLYQIASPQPEVQTNKEGEEVIQQFPPNVVKIMEQGFAEQKAKQVLIQEKRRIEFDKLTDSLSKYGYEYPERGEDIAEHRLRGLQEQLYMEQRKYDELRTMLSEDFRKLKVPSNIQDLLNTLYDSDDSSDDFLRRQIADKLILWVHDEQDKKNKPSKKYGVK
jgi:hypothetical protein